MVLVSIIIGLGVTHILTSLGSAVHRLRGHGKPLRLEVNYVPAGASTWPWGSSWWSGATFSPSTNSSCSAAGERRQRGRYEPRPVTALIPGLD
jgi:hypothetical protein